MVDTRRPRIDSIDIMRGVIMVIMALDHVRDYWTNAAFDPTNAEVTTPAYFATRWITHLCAPWFMVLAGAGAYLSLGRSRDKRSLVRFLITRGLWLIVLELTVLNVGSKANNYDPTFMRFMILGALGTSMLALALFVHLPVRAIAIIAIVMIAGHNLLDGIEPDRFGSFAWLWEIIHQVGIIGAEPYKGWSVLVLYPVIPWIGVMALGYCGGAWIESLAPERRARSLALAGVGTLVAFVVVRTINVYGDPQPWTSFDELARSVMSFLDVAKYPPSLDFLLATIGVGLVMLAIIERTVTARPWQFFRTFGRVPMFFYVVHIFAISFGFSLAYRIANGHWAGLQDAWGFGLPVVYAVWITYIAALYLPCRWFGGVKERRHDWWLGYI